VINNGRIQVPLLRLWLSVEAAERINERISSCQISILEGNPHSSLSDRRACISDKAVEILEAAGQSIEGCDGEKNVHNWLLRENSKTLPVFKALCKAVDEDWFDSLDRPHFEELLERERTKVRKALSDT
jgi:hypothetical protein